MRVSKDLPRTTRDHEILALANQILQACKGQRFDVIIGALAQALLNILRKCDEMDKPEHIHDLETLLDVTCDDIRDLPQEPVQ